MRDNVLSTTTRYGLNGPGIESWQGRDFPHLSRPALGPNPALVQWVSGDFRRYSGQDVTLTTPI